MLGPPLPARLPERVQATIKQDQDQTEILVSFLQLLAVASFAALYTFTPKAFDPQSVPFEPVPVTLAVYLGFTLVGSGSPGSAALPAWFVALSVVVDIGVLMVTIWSFHLQYQEPPPIYLKAPTMLYAFILIALRTLRFEPWLVVLAGATAAVGWLALVAYAVLGAGGAQITRDFATYAMSYQVLLGAEIDKVVSLLMVTLILTLGWCARASCCFGRSPIRWPRPSCRASSRPRSPGVSARATWRSSRPGRVARCRDPDGRPAWLHAAQPPARPAGGHGAPVRVSVPGGGGGQRSRRQHRRVHGRRHPGQLRRHPSDRDFAADALRAVDALLDSTRRGPRSGARAACRRRRSAPRWPPGR